MRKLTLLLLVLAVSFGCAHNRIQFGPKIKQKKKEYGHIIEDERSFSTQVEPCIKVKVQPTEINDDKESTLVRANLDTLVPLQGAHPFRTAENKEVTGFNRTSHELRTQPRVTEIKTEEKTDANAILLALLASLGLTVGLSVAASKTNARKISEWAKNNSKLTVGLILGVKGIMGVAGLYAGKMMYESGLEVSENLIYAGFGATALAAITYPRKNSSLAFFKGSYLRRKGHDVVLTVAGLLLSVTMGNRVAADPSYSESVSGLFETTSSISSKNKNTGAFNNSFHFKEIKSSLEESVFSMASEKQEMTSGVKILLTILAIIALAAAMYGLVVAYCSLSCSGQEGLAILVLIGGGAVAIGLFTAAMISMWGNKKST